MGEEVSREDERDCESRRNLVRDIVDTIEGGQWLRLREQRARMFTDLRKFLCWSLRAMSVSCFEGESARIGQQIGEAVSSREIWQG